MRLFLLDTSVIRGTGAAELERVRRLGVPLACSSYSFWEVLAHLDEGYGPNDRGRGQQEFQRVRANLIKMRDLIRIGDPYAQFVAVAGLDERPPIEDEETIERVYQVLDRSSSIFQFDRVAADIGHPSMSMIAFSTRHLLNEREGRWHTEYIQRLRQWLADRRVDLEDDRVFHDLIHEALTIEAREAVARGADPDGILNRIAPAFYLRASYFLERGRRYARNLGLRPDPNDFVDGNLCRHLDARREITFVTMDGGTVEALTRTVERLARLNLPCAVSVCRWPIAPQVLEPILGEVALLRETVREEAYREWLHGGTRFGHDVDDWLFARRRLRVHENHFL